MSKTAANDTHVLADVVDQLKDDTSGEQVSAGDILDAFDDRSIGALCTVIGIIAATPVVGAIPGMSIITGTLVLLIAGQFVLGRRSPWVPTFLTQRSITRDKLTSAIDTIRPYATWTDQFVKPRLQWLVGGNVQRRVIAAVMCLLALTMYPLALVPWGVQPPATAIMLFGVAIMSRDGLFAALGYALSAATILVMIYFWSSISSAFTWLF